MSKIAFFGLGAVGSVMATALDELYEKYGLPSPEYIFFVRNKQRALDYLWKSLRVVEKSVFLEIPDFNFVQEEVLKYREFLDSVDLCVNAAIPEFNDSIQRIALELRANYCDFASDMYNEETLASQEFLQYKYDRDFRLQNNFSLINIGISPGVTNFLIGEKLKVLRDLPYFEKIKCIEIFLLENINSEKVIFSWSPEVALEELRQKPRFYEDGELISVEPFTNAKEYKFPTHQRSYNQYPIYQEEVLSLHHSFPEIPCVKIYTGGSEVEVIKNLYQLNLLSESDLRCLEKGMTLVDIVKTVLPDLQTPYQINEMIQNGIIKNAQFSAFAEISIEVLGRGEENSSIQEVVGVTFHDYLSLVDTSYSGATYIAYPTGVGAAVLLFYTYLKWLKSKNEVKGVISPENLPEIIGISWTDWVKRELSMYGLDFSSSIRYKK